MINKLKDKESSGVVRVNLGYFLRKIFIRNQQNYIMNSRSERHKEYSDSRTDQKK